MKTILRSDIPKDFSYYRTGSKVFYEYYKNYTELIIHRIGKRYEFLRAGRIIGNIYSVIIEKIDTEPTREILKKIGIHHGIVFWWPMRVMKRPKWWFKLPTILLLYYEYFHSTRSAFSVLDCEDYWNKWSPSARAHRRKVLKLKETGRLRIEQIDDVKIFLEIYKKTKVPDPHKAYLINWCEKKFALWNEGTRLYLAYVDNIPLAWAIFIDEGVTSEYFTSFYASESHPYHLWIAIMDKWFQDSYTSWIKYCDLDHMRDAWQAQSYAGYTKFKESIADYDVRFHDMWIKFF